jgi:hypothetical protein
MVQGAAAEGNATGIATYGSYRWGLVDICMAHGFWGEAANAVNDTIGPLRTFMELYWQVWDRVEQL